MAEGGVSFDLFGLEPDNLLAFLALLGVLRALEKHSPELCARVAWYGEPPVARLSVTATLDRSALASRIDRGIQDLNGANMFKERNLKFKPDQFRNLAIARRRNLEQARVIAALGSDLVIDDDGYVQRTPFCALFGSGHQYFLERLYKTTSSPNSSNRWGPGEPENWVESALFERWRYRGVDGKTDNFSFRWDPIESRLRAYQFGDPTRDSNKIGTIPGANRLAAIGFGLLTNVPAARGLATIGVKATRVRKKKGPNYTICWPLVGIPTTLAGHLALLAHPSIIEENLASELASYGVAYVCRARRIQEGKYANFESASLQRLEIRY